jgi:acetyl-CoA carboxylase biotin carboxyl carrier protein
MLVELDLSEIEVTAADVRVRLQRRVGDLAAPATPAAAPAAATEVTTPLVTVEAPMVGTFYRASAPAADPYVREGDVVKPGQILCIIEAMKLMNEIESKVSGRIHKVLVDNAQAVEYGQPLFLLDPLR